LDLFDHVSSPNDGRNKNIDIQQNIKLMKFIMRNSHLKELFKASIIPLCLILLTGSCTTLKSGTPSNSSLVTLSIDYNHREQQIEAFGASDAWSCQFLGNSWPVDKREKIAKWLFSKEIDPSGNPLGIGLSGWRFNIGAGSTEQGIDSEIKDEWRRAECFLNQDGTYDWNKQKGQVWFLKKAKSYGVENLTAFVNSPPVFYTRNGKSWANKDSVANLKADKFVDFAAFMAKVIKEVKSRENISINSISPLNEPQWNWDNKGQEGSPYTNGEISKLTRQLSKSLLEEGLSTQIELADAAHIAYIYSSRDKPSRGRQAYEFFSESSDNYVGNLPNLALKICGHSYFSTFPINTMIQERKKLTGGMAAINPKLRFLQTEYCLLEDNSEIKGNGRDLGIETALYTARLIHFDLTIANSSGWYWWLAISPYNYKDGLIYTDYDKNNGNIYDSKTMWALGNFSRFIRPGMYRYDVLRSDSLSEELSAQSLMVSSYSNENHASTVFVLVNYSKTKTFDVKFNSNDKRKEKSINTYTTTKDVNLKYSSLLNIGEILNIMPRSIATVVIEY
jgi:hypothetical protein